jgi:hypothetical protein
MFVFNVGNVFAVSTTKFPYFGYYWGMNGIDSLKNVNTMFISNQYGMIDINKLAQNDIDDLIKLNQRGVKGIIDISSVFYDLSKFDNLGHYPLRDDWESRFNTYWRLIYPYLGMVRAFYPMDEPDMNVDSLSYARVTHIIKINIDTTSYNIPILMVMTASGVIKLKNNNLNVPSEVSWLGFDEYGCWGVECFGNISITEKENIISSFMNSRKGFMIMVGDGSLTNIPDQAKEDVLIQRNTNYINLCNNTPNCMGTFIFLWQTMSSQGLYGVSSMPSLLNFLNGL